ncbi:hypothetical protein Taro_021357, partial [Colocasia esculenta]|nr:hypothetical protein [Colocasia esculenta]
FRKRYGFLYDEELPSEKKDKQLKSGSGPSRNSDAEILADHKKKEREAAKRGKQPFYLKKSEIRERKLVQKYNELKASGKLESFMEMKRKKNASKDARKIVACLLRLSIPSFLGGPSSKASSVGRGELKRVK